MERQFVLQCLLLCASWGTHSWVEALTLLRPCFITRTLKDDRRHLESSTFDDTTDVTFHSNQISMDRRGMLAGLAFSIAAAGYTIPAVALSPEEASGAYDSYANTYNELDGGVSASALGINEARASLCRKAKGRVLEIGVGTGLNLDYYNNIESLTLVDISEGMLQQAKERIRTLSNLKGVERNVVKADATRELVNLFGQGSFDTVVDTFSLCVMGKEGAKAAVRQMSQLVKPDQGRILLLENTKSSNKYLGWYQDLTAETAASAGGKGCVYNQDVTAMLEDTPGLKIVQEQPYAAGLFRSFECISTAQR